MRLFKSDLGSTLESSSKLAKSGRKKEKDRGRACLAALKSIEVFNTCIFETACETCSEFSKLAIDM